MIGFLFSLTKKGYETNNYVEQGTLITLFQAYNRMAYMDDDNTPMKNTLEWLEWPIMLAVHFTCTRKTALEEHQSSP